MALYLKYRPQNFDEIVGQDFIKTTLRNAIAQNKTVGAYIFTGPRGTGKTSTARIFAKALNCFISSPRKLDDIYFSFKKEFQKLLNEYSYSKDMFIEDLLSKDSNSSDFTKILNDFSKFIENYTDVKLTIDNFFDFIPIDYFYNGNNFELLSKNRSAPCLVCSNCHAFRNDRIIDIVEIDAASYTGVDNIRDIIDKAQFRPTQTKYKIYIIDEVHMLSKGAFNALLKILEEPPEHVKFILATTDIHKVPETILSRCQRYDFKNFSADEITQQLEFIAKNEGIQIDDKSMEYIVMQSRGGMRNAVSLFEQMIHEGNISYEHISKNLGIAHTKQIQEMISLLTMRSPEALSFYTGLFQEGKNMKLFFLQVLEKMVKNMIEALGENKEISRQLQITQILESGLIRSKNAPDENMCFQIMILEILSGQESSGIKENSSFAPTAVSQKMNLSLASQESKENTKNEVSPGDIEDIFGNIPDSHNAVSQESGNTAKFDSQTFFTLCKSLGAKAALTLSLKGCILKLEGQQFHIGTKTKIAESTIEKAESVALITEVLEKMGYKDLSIHIYSC